MTDALETARGLRQALERVLERVEAGELKASTGMRYRLEGAIAALAVVLGEEPIEALKVAELKSKDPLL